MYQKSKAKNLVLQTIVLRIILSAIDGIIDKKENCVILKQGMEGC